MPIVTELHFTADLRRGITMQPLKAALVSGDSEAHRFVVACCRGDTPVDLAGAGVHGYFIRANGSTVVVDGTVENGRATLTLPTPCYAYPGRFSLVIKASLNGSVNTILWAEGAVGRCTTDTVVNPGEVLPTLDQLLAQIDAMEEATAQAIAAREDMQQELSGLGVMHRTTHTGSKTIVLKDVIPSGSSIYFRPVSCTDAAVTGLTIYGMYGASASEGYDTLKANCPYGTTQVFTASREYHHLQLAPFPSMASADETILYDLLVTEVPGLQKDVSTLQGNVTSLQSGVTNLQDAVPGNVRASNSYISPSNAASALPDANNAANGLTYFISNEVTDSHIKNLPMYGQFATLTTIHYHSTVAHGKFQLYAGTKYMYMRTESGSGTSFTTWSDWQELTNHGAEGNLAMTAELLRATGLVAGAHYYKEGNGVCIDFKDFTPGQRFRIVVWNIENPLNGDQPNVYVFKTDGTHTAHTKLIKTGQANIYEDIATGSDTAYIRLYMNKQGAAAYAACDYAIFRLDGNPLQAIETTLRSDITALAATAHQFPRTTCKIFRRVVCCGDSYTSGHIAVTGASSVTNEAFAWPAYMSLFTGSPWENCGCSGCNVLTWQTHERGLPKAQALGQAQAYVIGLMINDASATDRAVPLGTAADIGTDAQTYYGGMSAIIRALNAISPQAKIFVNTCPKTDSAFAAYNQAVREIVAAYQDTYPVHCIDLAAHADLYSLSPLKDDAVGGHYTAVGYQQFAEIYGLILSDYINSHLSAFQNVHAISYDS